MKMENASLDFRLNIPLYKQLVDVLINEVVSSEYKEHDKFYTERELHKKFKISTRTAREAVNELVFRDLLYRRPQKGTFIKKKNIYETAVNTSLKENTLIFLYPESYGDVNTHSFFSNVYRKMEEVAIKNGYYLELFILNRETIGKEKILFNKIARNKLDGIFLMGPSLSNELIKNIADTGVPAVIVDSYAVDKRINTVGIDNKYATLKAVKYLYDKGHRRIGFIGVDTNNRNIAERFEGYKEALKHFNIPVEDKHIAFSQNSFGRYGYSEMEALLQSDPPPTAIFAASDELAAGAMECISDHKLRVPEDISIFGFNDTLASGFKPPMDTMKVDRDEMGKAAMRMIIDMIGGKTIKIKEKYIKPVLVERESVRTIHKI
jgi:LacI family transcriptional regulator